MAFHFEKPGGFVYKAGQFADYTLINPSETDAEGSGGESLFDANFSIKFAMLAASQNATSVFRREGREQLFKTRVAAERIPDWLELQKTVA